MLYRLFRQKSTGQYLDLVMTTSGDRFTVPAESHVVAAAKACELDARDVEAVERKSDVRKGDLIPQRAPVTITTPTREEALVEALEEANTIVGMRKALLDYHGDVEAR